MLWYPHWNIFLWLFARKSKFFFSRYVTEYGCIYIWPVHVSDRRLFWTCIYFWNICYISNMHIFLTCIQLCRTYISDIHILCITDIIMHNIYIYFWHAYISDNTWINKWYMNKFLILSLLQLSDHREWVTLWLAYVLLGSSTNIIPQYLTPLK